MSAKNSDNANATNPTDTASNRLERLHTEFGQSPWLDNLRRGWLTGGELSRLVESGIRGLTSNPSIFQKSISGSNDYDEQFTNLIKGGSNTESAYWSLVTHDIVGALEVLRPVYESSDGQDGFVSVEVDPSLARDTSATIDAARGLYGSIPQPNLMVKIPGTAEGLPAIRAMIGEGRNVNVTLIFSVERYCEVAEAYIAGLEDLLEHQTGSAASTGVGGPDQGGPDLSGVASVASFFISRIDTEVDRRLEVLTEQASTAQGNAAQSSAAIAEKASGLAGKAAIASGQDAYQQYGRLFSGPRWEALAAHGARPQRPLWASTSTKNPSYPDTLYVDQLIGPNTVNTMPDDTLAAFVDHGNLARTVDADPTAPDAVLSGLADVGVDLADVCDLLESQGVSSFEKSFGELLDSLQVKALDLN